ncbi:uncharacterized protein LOC144094956 isoform X1 [Amblyomma americanum]
MLDWLLQVASPSQQLFEEPSVEPNVELHCIQHHILELSEPCRLSGSSRCDRTPSPLGSNSPSGRPENATRCQCADRGHQCGNCCRGRQNWGLRCSVQKLASVAEARFRSFEVEERKWQLHILQQKLLQGKLSRNSPLEA